MYLSLLLDLCEFNTINITKQDDFCIFRQRKPNTYCWLMYLLYVRRPMDVFIFYLIFIRIHFNKCNRKRLYFLGVLKSHILKVIHTPYLSRRICKLPQIDYIHRLHNFKDRTQLKLSFILVAWMCDTNPDIHIDVPCIIERWSIQEANLLSLICGHNT